LCLRRATTPRFTLAMVIDPGCKPIN